MNPIAMALVIVSLSGLFAVTVFGRLRLLTRGAPLPEGWTQDVRIRLGRVWELALKQTRMRDYFWAGVAHNVIFAGFYVLLLRTLVLWGRGFYPSFNLFVLAPEGFLGFPLGTAYGLAKDVFSTLVICGGLVFVYYRTINKQKRMTLSVEGLVILGIMIGMMFADVVYDGAALVLTHRVADECATGGSLCGSLQTITAPLAAPKGPLAWHAIEPVGTAMALALQSWGNTALVIASHTGFWLHSTLVLVFGNLLPRSKHFHVITAIPNVFFADTKPLGRLRPMAESTESLMEKVELAMEEEDPAKAPSIGHSKIEHFSWKDFLDFYTCTECGRCTDQCPAAQTGKMLSPKQLTLDLRGNLFARDQSLQGDASDSSSDSNNGSDADTSGEGEESNIAPVQLVPHVIDPEVLWACTTCRACEDSCPVSISYVDKIVQMRRHLVVIQGEFPAELNKPFEGMEVNGNPWNLSRSDRGTWADGLNVPLMREKPEADVLYWVGCAASHDQRAKKIARSTARLLQAAGVDFAILGEEETCTGDPARRAGNEYLFSMLAEANVETLNGYQEKGKKTILTTCPHCFNTLLNEYPDFGGKYDVVHHTDYLLGLLAEKKLVPERPVRGRVTYHDSCYLGRYNEVYDSPREILTRIPGVELVEPTKTRSKGLCCGAGGGQMWMEEQNKDRVNVKRTLQLVETGAETVASACPFCMTMLGDGLKATEKEETVRQLDVVELLLESCLQAPASTEASAVSN